MSKPDEKIRPIHWLSKAGTRTLIEQVIEAEQVEYLTVFQDRQLLDGHSAEVRTGTHPQREIQTEIGPVTVKIPKVQALDGEPVTFRSALYRCMYAIQDHWRSHYSGCI